MHLLQSLPLPDSTVLVFSCCRLAMASSYLFTALLLSLQLRQVTAAVSSDASNDWDHWWRYDGISGPDFWGILNPEFFLCNKGHRQSPIDIKPGLLLYDPNLKSIFVNKNRINGILENNGHSVVFHCHPNRSETLPVTINGGPLSYSYSFHALYIHFGQIDTYGSEHSISGFLFPGEIQIIGYNSDLYSSYEEAASKANGLVGLAIFLKLGNVSSPAVKILTSQLHHIKFKNQSVALKSLSLRELIQDEQNYVTYEGSLTIPSCEEVVTWIVINKPLFITKEQLAMLRLLMQGDFKEPTKTLGPNFRPTQSLNDRVVRTSIEFKSHEKGKSCPTMKRNVHYEVNQRLWST